MTAYTPTTLNYPQLANTAIRRYKAPRPPNTIKNFVLGDEWLDTSASPNGNWWKLSTLHSGGEVWVQLAASVASTIMLQGDTGGAVSPNGSNILFTKGTAGHVSVTGNPGTNTLTWDVNSNVAITFNADAGSATPSMNTITISGGSTGLTTSGSGSTVSLTGVLKLANGGTNANLTASNGGIFYSTATAGAILSGTATADQVLLSGSSTAPAWSTATYPATTTINQLLYSSAANTIVGLATVNDAALTTNATGVPTWISMAADGDLLIGSSAGAPAAATLTAGTGVTITNGHNSITIAANGSSVVFTITGNTGGILNPTMGNFNIVGNGATGSSVPNIFTSGAGSTLTIEPAQAQYMTQYTSVANAGSPYTVLSTDYYISCNSSTGVISILLPNAPTTNRLFIIKDRTGMAGTNNITVTTVGGVVLIDGQTSLIMDSNYMALNLIFSGTAYEVY